MKKFTAVILILALTTMLFTACTSQQATLEPIGTARARNVALEDAGLTEKDVKITGEELKEAQGLEYYSITFTADGQQYSYDVDAITGKIIQRNIPDRPQLQQTPQPPQIQQTPQPSATPANPADEKIGEDKAKAIAMEHAGVTADKVTFVKSGLDRDDGRLVYDVEFYTTDYQEYDYDIDAYSGEILSSDRDAEYYTPPRKENKNDTAITREKAKQIALAQVPGATESDIREFETDYDDGRLEYEGKIYYDNMEYEFEIDGYSGAIRNWEAESIYD